MPGAFDRDMISLFRDYQLLESAEIRLVYEHSDNKIIIFERAGFLFIFNFHPDQSYSDYRFEASPGKYRMIFNSDSPEYGGHNRLHPDQYHLTLLDTSMDRPRNLLSLYLPTRTALVLEPASSVSNGLGHN